MLNQGGPDRSNYFQFYPQKDEAKAYKQMLADQRKYGKEIIAYYVTQKGTNQKGILVLPWIDNSYNFSNPHIGMSEADKTITDDKGGVYIPFEILHTHPDNDGVKPSGLDGDLGALRYLDKIFPGMNGVIINARQYNEYNASGVSLEHGSNIGLINGYYSLFR